MAEPISVKDLIRMLKEYSEKASSMWTRHTYAVVSMLSLTVLASPWAVLAFRIAQWTDGRKALFLTIAGVLWFAIGTIGGMVVLRIRRELSFTVWHLRRVYELASRHEDLGASMDSATRMEFEIRLSEAGYMLTKLKRFDKPKKFRHHERVGRDSPFRALLADDSLLGKPRASATQTGEPAPQSTPPGPPESLVSPS